MDITEKNETLEFSVTGRIDTNSSPQLEAKIKGCPANVMELVLDLSQVEYISSGGLRVLLIAHKLMQSRGGKFAVRNPSDFCRRIFEATGMDSALVIR